MNWSAKKGGSAVEFHQHRPFGGMDLDQEQPFLGPFDGLWSPKLIGKPRVVLSKVIFQASEGDCSVFELSSPFHRSGFFYVLSP